MNWEKITMVEQSSFGKILDSLITSVIVVDASLAVVHVNTAAEVLLGISGEQSEGKPIEYCFSESGLTTDSLGVALRDNQNFTKRKAHWLLHNHQEITVDYSVIPNIETQQIIIEVQPLDRLLRISREEAWLSSQETSRNLVRSLAHEIKNPLGGIRGAAQLLARELGDENLEEYTRIIIEETDRLRNLVDRMLGPRTPLHCIGLNIHEVLEHVTSVMRLEAQDQIVIVKDYDPSIPELVGDKDQLIQATLNIVRNAYQALVEGEVESPRIIISTRVQRRYTIGRVHHPLVAHIGICDNGPGIPAGLIEDIFFPMITGRATGSGLGLAISQNIIGQHRGMIECSSEPGKTLFDIYLPLGIEYE